MDANLSMLAAGITLIVAALTGALVLRRRSRRAATPVAVDLTEPEPVEDDTPGETVTVRALRAQIRVLEEALANAAEPAPAPEPDSSDSYRHQVRTAVRAVTLGTTPDDDARYAVARVAAAIERLDHPGTFGRPVLPENPRRIVPEAAPRPALAAAVATDLDDRKQAPVLVPTQPQVEDDVEAHIQPIQPNIEASVEVEPEIVLPVPPPAAAEPRRGRRRLRHSAA